MKKGLNMRNLVILSIVQAIVVLLSEFVQAQGSLYAMNINTNSRGGGSIGTTLIASNRWAAQSFITGNNADGYLLNSVLLLMDPLIGNPHGLIVSLYGFAADPGSPGNNLATFGSDPIYDYPYNFDGSDFFLLPDRVYSIVLTAETPSTVGYFRWNYTNEGAQTSDGWAFSALYNSSDGLNWHSSTSISYQMAIYATAVPEPAAGVLFGLGLAALRLWRRQRQ